MKKKVAVLVNDRRLFNKWLKYQPKKELFHYIANAGECRGWRFHSVIKLGQLSKEYFDDELRITLLAATILIDKKQKLRIIYNLTGAEHGYH